MSKDATSACICLLCGRRFQLAPDRGEGRFIASYKIFACAACVDSNLDGWGPDYEALLRVHLEKNGQPLPVRLLNGLLPRE
ncbi:MAG: hypothetical protein JWM91_3041 [Rhodospirillales bacterium]|nr:hypothetical protein [Rhodospirillales bacterium]